MCSALYTLNTPTAPQVPQHKWLLRVCVFTSVCVHFGWVTCRAQVPSMSHSTWSYVTSRHYIYIYIYIYIQVYIYIYIVHLTLKRVNMHKWWHYGSSETWNSCLFSLSCIDWPRDKVTHSCQVFVFFQESVENVSPSFCFPISKVITFQQLSRSMWSELTLKLWVRNPT